MRQSAIAILVAVMTLAAATACSPAIGTMSTATAGTTPTIKVILTGLDNPRGVGVGPAGSLFVAEAGTGYDAVDPTKMTGRLTEFRDLNGDGDYNDADEAKPWFRHFPTYNAQHFTDSIRDEVGGPGDLLLHGDGRIFLAVDGGFDRQALYEISKDGRIGRTLADRSNMNGIAFDLDHGVIYVLESTFNQLIEVGLNGERRHITYFLPLASGQQAVPAGLAVDPRNGDVLVALFSGVIVDDETGQVILVVPGDAKVVRVDPETGQSVDEVTGLTAAIDVAMDNIGNLYVVEMTTAFVEPFPDGFDVADPDVPPLHGGYQRFDGRVTLHPPDGGSPRVLVKGLDTPTNITLAPDGALYVSTGQILLKNLDVW